MKDLKSIKFPPIGRVIKHFFARYHVVAFTVIVIGGLSVTTYLLNTVVASSADVSTTETQATAPEFDESTIERVNNLNESSGNLKPLDFPSSQRTNPFTE